MTAAVEARGGQQQVSIESETDTASDSEGSRSDDRCSLVVAHVVMIHSLFRAVWRYLKVFGVFCLFSCRFEFKFGQNEERHEAVVIFV